MCGRYLLYTPVDDLRRSFSFTRQRPNLEPRYNIAPTQTVPIVRLDGDGNRELALVRWGLIPSWAKVAGVGSRMINARAENIATSPASCAASYSRTILICARTSTCRQSARAASAIDA